MGPIEDEALDLLRCGATREELEEMRQALEYVLGGIHRRRGEWVVEPQVARFVAGRTPEHVCRRLKIGMLVLDEARALLDEIETGSNKEHRVAADTDPVSKQVEV
jgi:hypothetical protein